ncbi:MAG TPA: hypothetical protein VH418_15500 [Solirubrobacteraceae bacterium]
MRRAAVAAVVLALAACGEEAPDLFVVKRSGEGRNAKLTMVVSDDGTVTCNGRQHELPAKSLLQARGLTRDMGDSAKLALDLPARPGSVLSYQVRMQAGTIAFADTSRPIPVPLIRLEQFTADVSENVCGLSHD